MSISVGLDFSPLCGNPVGGIPSFITQLTGQLLRLDSENRYFQCYKFSRFKQRRSLFGVSSNLRRIWFGRRFVFPLRNLSVFHGTAEWLPPKLKTPKIITIHDMRGIRSDKDIDDNCRDQYRALKDGGVLVVTDSNFIKRQILERINGISPSRIVTIHLAGSGQFGPLASCKKKDRILFVGVITPNKNLLRAIIAFDRIRSQCEQTDFVICGRIGQENYYGEIMRFIRSRPGLSDRVKFIHTAGNDEVLALYNESRMCILPSVYEGFGIPVLEAQACGCPMLCSSIGPLMEVGGRGAFYCDPENVESIADAMKRLLQSESLQEDLRRKGFENSAKFTWEKTALAYREIYQRVARK